jgi:tRNA(Ile)-lysidine synthase
MIDIQNLFYQIQNHIPKAKSFVIACSGGVDSMVLLDIFRQQEKYKITVAHCNHMLRGEESKKDAEHVKSYAKKYNIPYYEISSDVKKYATEQHIGTEEAARKIRYNFLYDIQKKVQADGIVLAHHFDDQIETMIMRMIRGSGIFGLYGMSFWNQESMLLRPFLDISKQVLIKRANDNEISWREDQTNTIADNERNIIRLNILPLFEKMRSGYKEGFSHTQKNILHTCKYINEERKTWKEKHIQYDDSNNSVSFLQKDFIEKHKFLQFEILTSLWEDCYTSRNEIKSTNIQEIQKWIQTGNGKTEREFGKKYTMQLLKRKISLIRNIDK